MPWTWTRATQLDAAGPFTIDSLDQLALAAAAAELVPDAGMGGELMQARDFGAWCDAVAGVRQPPRQVIFRSSGSTGAPARTPHALARLDAEAAAWAGSIGTGRRRVLSALPAHHAYGFIHSVLLPVHLGDLPVVELRSHAPAAVAGLVRSGDLVLGHPLFWDLVLRGLGGAFPPDVVGITSSAPCPAETALGLREAGLARLLQVYGASETAGIGWRDDPAAPYALLPGWRRARDHLEGGGMIVEPPDRLQWVDDARFHVLGRRDGTVQVGGVNVLPALVADALRRHPAVADVAVRAMHADEGTRLKAFIVPTPDAVEEEALRAALRRFAASALSPAECPGAYRFGAALPRTENGKLSDWNSG